MNNQYQLISVLSNIYLEDSYILGIHELGDSLEFDIDAVLTEDHELFCSPKPDEQYCYHHIKLIFDGVTAVEWINRSSNRNTDPDGSVDFGNIDLFEWENKSYHLLGEWGEIKVECDDVKVA